MKLNVTVSRDGRAVDASLAPTMTIPLYCTPAARNRILAEMHKRGSICKKCFTVARSEELGEDGLCITGVGCSTDVDRELLSKQLTWEQIHAATDLPRVIWNVFIDSLPRRGDQADMPPLPNEEGDW